MTRMTVITPSVASDFDLCAALNRSVLDNTPGAVQHHIIVPRSQLALFGRLTGPRTRVFCEMDFLPRSFVRVPFKNVTLNLGRPFPPIRGWILQQVVKLAAVAASEADVVVLVDSDIEFIRPFTAETFVNGGTVRFYRKPHEIDARLPRHVRWHLAARELLGLPRAEAPYTDYVSSLLAWDPKIVRQLLARVAATTGCVWTTAIARQLHFSEWTLYGVFVDHLMDPHASAFASDDSLCHAYWNDTPLSRDGAVSFLAGVRPTDVAAMISAKSRTPLAVRHEAFAVHRAARTRVGGSHGGSPVAVAGGY